MTLYQRRWAFDAGGLCLFLIGTILAGVVLGCLPVAWEAVDVIPSLLILPTIAQGVLLGMVASKLSVRARLRPPALLALATLPSVVVCVVSEQIAWYRYLCWQAGVLPSFGRVWQFRVRAGVGIEMVNHGVPLSIKFADEMFYVYLIACALILTLLAVLTALRGTGKGLFCDQCGVYMSGRTRVFRADASAAPTLIAAVQQSDVAALDALPAPAPDGPRSIVAICTCPKCRGTYAEVILSEPHGNAFRDSAQQQPYVWVSTEFAQHLHALYEKAWQPV